MLQGIGGAMLMYALLLGLAVVFLFFFFTDGWSEENRAKAHKIFAIFGKIWFTVAVVLIWIPIFRFSGFWGLVLTWPAYRLLKWLWE